MSLMKKAIGGSIHRIREFELEKVNLIDEFDILQIVGEGWFGKILLTEHRSTQTEMVLKALPKAYTGLSDFFREFHYGLHLAAHRNIITTYDVAFETAGFYVFSQEYAPLGDLTSNVTETGLGELHAKRVVRQLAAAVHHIHSRELVHRDIKLDNVLVFRSDFSRIKLCDFGETRRANTVVRRHNEWLPYSPPEVLQIDTDDTYKCLTSHDVWQFGIVLFVCLTGCLPWQKAAMDDPRYTRYQNWHNATLNIAKKPKLFQLISSRAQRMFKRLLDPRAEKRPVSVLEINKYLEDRWLAKLGAEKALNGGADERDELCPSMYSFHSSLEEKNQLLHTLTTYGIETTVDRTKKKDRIREWIQASTIAEEYEEDESDLNEESRFHEDEEEEPASMKGRHFPETRPSATAANHHGRKNSRGTHTSSARKRLPVKPPVERKIPFAPQVAEERETVARFASFPNGDPNLATLKNGANGTAESESPRSHSSPVATRGEPVPEDARSPSIVNVNGRTARSSPSASLNTSQDGALQQAALETTSANNNVQDQPVNAAPMDDRIVVQSPEIPTRKHRSQTAPFAIPTSPYLNGNRRETAKRSHSVSTLTERSAAASAALPVARGEKSSAIMLPTRADNQPVGMSRSERSPTASHSDNRSAPAAPGASGGGGAVIARAERPPATGQSMSRVENQSVAMLPAAQVENQLANTSAITRNETSPPRTIQPAPVNPLTMSVASHLVMQSFNALQGINPLAPTKSSEATTASSNNPPNSPPTSTPTNRSPAGTPVRNTTPPTTKKPTTTTTPRVEEFISYGKDAYEHYGIAQGVILRAGNTRHGSSGSPSRSISN